MRRFLEWWSGVVEVREFTGWLSPVPGVGLRAKWEEWWWGRLMVHRRLFYLENGKWNKDTFLSRDNLYGEEVLAPKGCLMVRKERRA